MAEGKSTLNALTQGLNKFPKVPLSSEREEKAGFSSPLTNLLSDSKAIATHRTQEVLVHGNKFGVTLNVHAAATTSHGDDALCHPPAGTDQ